MRPVPDRSPVTGAATTSFYIHADSSAGHFRDSSGRCLLLRGINLASSAKTPKDQPSHQLEGFWEGAETGDVSFVNRVLDLDLDPSNFNSADTHLKRLRSWGFNVIRYITTWESIEHKGPGQYDEDYLDYTVRMLRKCKQYGFHVFMDPHQDLWSRYSGGDGAPFWTIVACGLNPRNFTATNAAVIQCEWPEPDNPDPANFPDMIWASNYTRLAVMTLNTLFFAGKTYAPMCEIDGMNIQDYLQSHYIAAYRRLGEAIRDAGDLYDVCVIGWDSMNEPNHGLVGLPDVSSQPKKVELRIGPMPTAFEAMKLGMGIPTTVERWKFGPLGPKKDGNVHIDPQGASAWLDEAADLHYGSKYGWKRSSKWPAGQCVWALHGVWDIDQQQVLIHDYFSRNEPDFGRDFWQTHWLAWAKMVRDVHPEAIHFVHPPVFQLPPEFHSDDCKKAIADRAVFSTHFYDGLTLITKHWNWFNADAIGLLRGKYSGIPFAIRIGDRAIRKVMRDQLGYLRQDTIDTMGDFPTMVGEIGVPFDLDKRQAYDTGDYSNQAKALDASLNACDGGNLMNYTIWTYNPENSHKWGENWNGEDLSVWSSDDAGRRIKSVLDDDDSASSLSPMIERRSFTGNAPDDLNSGARALRSFVRPYPMAVNGKPISIDFDVHSAVFKFVVERDGDSAANGPTEIFLPGIHYGPTSREAQSGPRRSPTTDKKRSKLVQWHEAQPNVLVKVELSSGGYEVQGEMLRWHHDRMSGPGPSRHTITIGPSGEA